MASRIRQLIPNLLVDSRLEQLQVRLAQSCRACLRDQGLQEQSEPSFTLQDTGVGAMRKLSAPFIEPESGAALQLVVCLLAKVDGSVQLWSELWGTPASAEAPAEATLARTVRLGLDTQVTLPSRIRLVRQNYFDARVGAQWAQHQDPLSKACSLLDSHGLFATTLQDCDQANLAAALAP